jgi:hypothetical protein
MITDEELDNLIERHNAKFKRDEKIFIIGFVIFWISYICFVYI